jgi:hypothetical protein
VAFGDALNIKHILGCENINGIPKSNLEESLIFTQQSYNLSMKWLLRGTLVSNDKLVSP